LAQPDIVQSKYLYSQTATKQLKAQGLADTKHYQPIQAAEQLDFKITEIGRQANAMWQV
jgi:hypothetical protein